jgi:hypothetical protein
LFIEVHDQEWQVLYWLNLSPPAIIVLVKSNIDPVRPLPRIHGVLQTTIKKEKFVADVS